MGCGRERFIRDGFAAEVASPRRVDATPVAGRVNLTMWTSRSAVQFLLDEVVEYCVRSC